MQKTLHISPPFQHNTGAIQIVRGGREYFDLLIRLINNARETIHLQTYIYDDDETGKLVATALKNAVDRNVAVYLLADGYASQVMSQQFIDELRSNGIHFRFFEPLLKSKHFYFGRRLHHKIVVIDSSFTLVGGINITNRYNDMPGKPAWLDFALYAENVIGRELEVLCKKTWSGFSGRHLIPDTPNQKQLSFSNRGKIMLRRNDWVRKKNEIHESYLRLFDNASSEIIIVCSYFLPGRILRNAIAKAAARGIIIKVLIAGQSDVMIAKHAERWLYDWLLRNKVLLYEYQPAVLHAKLAICDSEWFTIGSYNINDISTYASIELNLEVYEAELTVQVKQMVNEIIQEDSIPLTLQEHKRSTNFLTQFKRWCAYLLIRIIFSVVTSYYKQRG